MSQQFTICCIKSGWTTSEGSPSSSWRVTNNRWSHSQRAIISRLRLNSRTSLNFWRTTILPKIWSDWTRPSLPRVLRLWFNLQTLCNRSRSRGRKTETSIWKITRPRPRKKSPLRRRVYRRQAETGKAIWREILIMKKQPHNFRRRKRRSTKTQATCTPSKAKPDLGIKVTLETTADLHWLR